MSRILLVQTRTNLFINIFTVVAAILVVSTAQAAEIVVTTFADEYNCDIETAEFSETGCSLREAVHSANTNTACGGCTAGESGVTDTITLSAGTYTLTKLCGFNEFSSDFISEGPNGEGCGDLDLVEDVIVNGAGKNDTIVEWANVQDQLASQSEGEAAYARIFEISENPEFEGEDFSGQEGHRCEEGCSVNIDATISNMTLTGGREYNGGAIKHGGGSREPCNYTRTTLQNLLVTGNSAHYNGGAVDGYGQLIVIDSEFTDNLAGDHYYYYYYYGDGGAISLYGPENGCAQQFDSSISGSTITDNWAKSGIGGGLHNSYYSNLNITNTNIDENGAYYAGGGVANIKSNLSVTGGSISRNAGVADRFLPVDEDHDEDFVFGTFFGGGLFNSKSSNRFIDTLDKEEESNYTVTVDGVTIDGNTAIFGGAGIANTGYYGLLPGGVDTIDHDDDDDDDDDDNRVGFPKSTLTVTGSSVTNNTLQDTRYRGRLINGGSEVEADFFLRRIGSGSGAGIYNEYRSSLLEVIETTVDGNTGGYVGAGIYNGWVGEIVRSTISNNITEELVWIDQESLKSRDNIDINTSGGGGGVANQGSLDISNTTISGNTTSGVGGGVANNMSEGYHYSWLESTGEVNGTADGESDSEFVPLPAPGVRMQSCTVVQNAVIPPTISDNNELLLTDEFYYSLFVNNGGGIATIRGNISVANTIVATNTDTSDNLADAFYTPSPSASPSASPSPSPSPEDPNNLFSSVAPDCFALQPEIEDCQLGVGEPCEDYAITGIISNGYNLLGDNTGCDSEESEIAVVDNTNFDQVGTGDAPIDPLLGPLQDNGGPTFTHLPEVGSPVIDAGNPTPVSGTTVFSTRALVNAADFACNGTDQRNIQRSAVGTFNGAATCDIGAIERSDITFGCDGVPFGNAVLDVCGQCGGDGTSCIVSPVGDIVCIESDNSEAQFATDGLTADQVSLAKSMRGVLKRRKARRKDIKRANKIVNRMSGRYESTWEATWVGVDTTTNSSCSGTDVEILCNTEDYTVTRNTLLDNTAANTTDLKKMKKFVKRSGASKKVLRGFNSEINSLNEQITSTILDDMPEVNQVCG